MNLTLPNDQDFYWKDGSLWCEGVSLETLARKFGTPLYVYSKHALVSAFNAYQSALADYPHLVCFALKANSNLSSSSSENSAPASISSRAENCSASRPRVATPVRSSSRASVKPFAKFVKHCLPISNASTSNRPRNSTVSSRSHPNLNCAQESPSASTRMWMLKLILIFLPA